MKKNYFSLMFFSIVFVNAVFSQNMIINHTNAFLEPIPEWAIKLASDSLHIAYGHTSHGSQLTTGMKALANQSTELKGYKGDYYCWEEYHEVYGDNPCLDIDDRFVPGDLGHNGSTDWANRTRDYLLNRERAKDINVVMWSWCGGCSDNTDEGIQTYLETMNDLEKDFPDIVFVYMTGHLDHYSDATLKHNNQLIRDYCITNNKVLFDFADIESYDPDGNYFEFSNDNCDYYNENGDRLGNWAEEWQQAHEHGVDWYICSAAHTKPLNGNRKAYATWWMLARLVGWNPGIDTIEITEQPQNIAICDKGKVKFNLDYNNADSIRWQKKSAEDTVFSNLYDDDVYTGTDLKTLEITFENDSLDGYHYRAIIYLNDSVVKSDSALLTIYKFIQAKTQEVDEACSDEIVLKGSNPSPGTCKWSVMTGNSTIDTASNFIANAKGLSFGKNIFRFTTLNGLCNDTSELIVYRYDNITITKHPDDITAKTGVDTTFEVKVDGEIEFVQWYKNDEVLTDGVKYSGTNKLKLTIKNIRADDKGRYRCDVSGYCNDESSNEALLDVLTSTKNKAGNEIIVFPNPAKNTLFVRSGSIINSIELFDISGKQLLRFEKLKNPEVDVSSLNRGIYFLKITCKNMTLNKKIEKIY